MACRCNSLRWCRRAAAAHGRSAVDSGIVRFVAAELGRRFHSVARMVCLQGKLRRPNRLGHGLDFNRGRGCILDWKSGRWSAVGFLGHHWCVFRLGVGQQPHPEGLGSRSSADRHAQGPVRRDGQHLAWTDHGWGHSRNRNSAWFSRHRFARLWRELGPIHPCPSSSRNGEDGGVFLIGTLCRGAGVHSPAQ